MQQIKQIVEAPKITASLRIAITSAYRSLQIAAAACRLRLSRLHTRQQNTSAQKTQSQSRQGDPRRSKRTGYFHRASSVRDSGLRVHPKIADDNIIQFAPA